MVATHEIGHALGLGHSNVPGSVMRPFYDENVAQLRLGTDDILAIRELYSKRFADELFMLPFCLQLCDK